MAVFGRAYPGLELPRDCRDLRILPDGRLLLARAGLGIDDPGVIEVRSLDYFDAGPEQCLPFRGPLVLDRAGERLLVQGPLIEGYEVSTTVLELENFSTLATLPVTAPYAFVDDDAPVLARRAASRPPSRAVVAHPDAGLAARAETPPPASLLARRRTPRAIVATMPHSVADEVLIARQPYRDVLQRRFSRLSPSEARRCPVVIDYAQNRLCTAHWATPEVQAMHVDGADALLSITRGNVFVRRASLSDQAIDWDYAVGQNRSGNAFSCYASALAETSVGLVLAVGIYDHAVEFLDARQGICSVECSLDSALAARIDAICWIGARTVAIGLKSGMLVGFQIDTGFRQNLRISDRGVLAIVRLAPHQIGVLCDDQRLHLVECAPNL